MISRKEEERNEKVIRGLMKLPPNRRCINCDSLGPQYVCTNFWTFVCITCSGIHREFTHRVKSVSMAKFTTQEVEALQKGGNQRAREIFLKDWDMQNQRLPNSSNVDKIREFIKNVYVEKRYARGVSSDKPPRDMQNHRNTEEDRKASSYHSYSQSPPYDHQYEERRYGKPSGVLTRRTGSDRLHYDGKVSSIVYSPGHAGDVMYEDRFANECSGSRYSDYSVSSVGEALSYDVQSPIFQNDTGYSPSKQVQDILFEHKNATADVKAYPHSQITISSGSIESSNSMPLKSVNSDSLMDVGLESEQPTGSHQPEVSIASCTQSTAKTHAFQPDIYGSLTRQPSTDSSDQFIDLFADNSHAPSKIYSEQKPAQVHFPENKGWATFDLPQHAGTTSEPINSSKDLVSSRDGISKTGFVALSSQRNSLDWPYGQSSVDQTYISLATEQWNLTSQEASQTSVLPFNSEFWNAFDDSARSSAQAPVGSFSFKQSPQIPADKPLSSADAYIGLRPMEDSNKYGFQNGGISLQTIPFGSGVVTGRVIPSPSLPSTGGKTHEWKSQNPFDVAPLDMSSLQEVLSNPQISPPFQNTVSSPLFSQNSDLPYITSVLPGSMSFMPGQPPITELPNLPSQSQLASLGRNPFA